MFICTLCKHVKECKKAIKYRIFNGEPECYEPITEQKLLEGF